MGQFGHTIYRLREERGWTQAELAKRVGMTRTAVVRREAGKIAVKLGEHARWAKVFGMTIEKFREEAAPTQVTRTVGGPGIPVINRAPAGQIMDYEEHGVDSGQGFEYLDWGDIRDDLAFAVVVVGDSMEPALVEGDYLILSSMGLPKPRAKLEDGAVVFVRFGPNSNRRGCTIARWYKQGDGSIVLRKDNARHKPIICQPEDIEQLAVAIERRSKRI